jgi:hypothetical protein
MEMERLVARRAAQRTLLEGLSPERVEVFTVPVPDTAPKIGWDGTAPGPAVDLEMPFSRDKTFTLTVLDEGPPEPQCAHTKHAVGAGKEGFLRHYREAPLSASQLTLAKLERLMRRYLHRESHPAVVRPANVPAPFVANRLDFPEVERADVLRGLRTFAADLASVQRLAETYRALPPELKALGDDFSEGGTEAMRARLASLSEEFTPLPSPAL